MRLLEYESKEILRKYQISTPAATLTSKRDPLNIKGPVMLKSQIPVGGRGKSGGILEASTNDDAKTTVFWRLPPMMMPKPKSKICSPQR
jgi:succinyl-CoA synthetase beta subunit